MFMFLAPTQLSPINVLSFASMLLFYVSTLMLSAVAYTDGFDRICAEPDGMAAFF